MSPLLPLTSYPADSGTHSGVQSWVGTIPSWRMVVDLELAKLSRFKQFLRAEDRVIFDDLIIQCKLYAAEAGTLASPVKEVPLLLSMIFAQHKRLMKLEKRERQCGCV